MGNTGIQNARYQSVRLAQIDFGDERFRITTRTDIDDLAVSIQKDGLITPPLLANNPPSFTIVSGFRRLSACRKIALEEITAGILIPELSSHECLRIAIAENALQRPLNLIETARSFEKLSAFVKGTSRLAESASLLGLPSNPALINKIRPLCRLPGPIQEGILSETISLAMAVELGALDPECGITFVRLFDQLKISLNKQRELVCLVKEISRMENISIQDVLDDRKLEEILNNDDLDRSQKGRKIRTLLRLRRFPRISKAEQDFEFNIKNLQLGRDIKLVAPADFEGTAYSLNLTFSNLTELKALQTRLDRIVQNPSLLKILARDEEPSEL